MMFEFKQQMTCKHMRVLADALSRDIGLPFDHIVAFRWELRIMLCLD